jgi:hypothetical protein
MIMARRCGSGLLTTGGACCITAHPEGKDVKHGIQ